LAVSSQITVHEQFGKRKKEGKGNMSKFFFISWREGDQRAVGRDTTKEGRKERYE